MVLGRDVLLEVLRTEGVTHIFGNPGSTELPLIDALAERGRPALRARAAGGDGGRHGRRLRPGHRPAGVRQPAHRGRSRQRHRQPHQRPGQRHAPRRDRRAAGRAPPRRRPAAVGRPRRAGRARSASGPTRCARPTSSAPILRRAFHDADGPAERAGVRVDPDGPPRPRGARPRCRRGPPSTTARWPADLDALADLLVGPAPGELAIVAGDEVAAGRRRSARSSPWPRRSAPRCAGSPLHGRAVFPPTHPLWKGMLAPATAAIRSTLAPYSTGCSSSGARRSWSTPAPTGRRSSPPPSSSTSRPAPGPVARAHPVRARRGRRSLRATLAALAARDRGPVGLRRRAAPRSSPSRAPRRRPSGPSSTRTAASRYGPAPMDPMAAAHALRRGDAAGHPGRRRGDHHRRVRAGLPPQRRRRHATSSTGAAGSAGACRWPTACRSPAAARPVLCVVGDGSAMYSPQALWTAVARAAARALRGRRQRPVHDPQEPACGAWAARRSQADRFVGMDLDEPTARLPGAGHVDGRGVVPASSRPTTSPRWCAAP